VEVPGVPPVKLQDQDVGELVERSVKLVLLPDDIDVELAEKLATGAPPPELVTLI
jgi:hypothetical protein